MLDKYFGFLRVYDEFSVMESLIDHTRIDEEELLLLIQMFESFTSKSTKNISEYANKLRTINMESHQLFETISDQIIQANFDHQKQYDLLRIHQRIETISSLILLNASRLNVTQAINAELPDQLHVYFKKIGPNILELHKLYMDAMKNYIENKKNVMPFIHQVEDQELRFQSFVTDTIQELYLLGNTQSIPIGTFMLINDILNHMSELGFAIKSAATSIDWLLINH